MDAGIGSINYKGTSVSGVYNNGSSTSQINFRGNHDLGGGMKADFRVETDWNTVVNAGNTGNVPSAATTASGTGTPADATYTTTLSGGAASTFGNGEIRTGLATSFGRFDLGAVNYTTLDATLAGQPFGTAIGSGFRTLYVNDAQATSQVRAGNSLKYTSPVMNGLSLTLYNSSKQTKAAGTNFSTSYGAYEQIGVKEAGVKYSNGPINAVYVQLKQDNAGVGTGTTVDTVSTLAANYTFGASKVMLLNQTNKNDASASARNNKTTTVSGTHTIGAFTLMLQSGNTQNSSGAKSNFTGLGADYALSKMANIYFRSEKNTNGGGTVAAALTPTAINGSGSNFDRSALGLRVAF